MPISGRFTHAPAFHPESDEKGVFSRYKGETLVFLATMCWGSSYLFVQMGLETIAPFNLIALRFTTAFIATSGIIYPTLMKRGLRDLRYGFLLGLLLFLGNTCLTLGLKRTSIANAGFLVGTTVVFVAVMHCLLKKTRPKPSLLFGLALTMAGAALLSLAGGDVSVHLGDALCLLSAFFFAVHIFVVERVSREANTLVATALQFGFTALFAWLTTLLAENPLFPRTQREWTAVLASSLVGLAIGFACQLAGQRYTPPTRTAFIFTFEPVFAVLFAALFGGESLTWYTFFGGGLLLAGLFVSEYKPKG